MRPLRGTETDDGAQAELEEFKDGEAALTFSEMMDLARSHIKLLTLGPISAALLAFGATYLIAPTFTARAVFLPPQQQQSLATTALNSLGALSGLAGAAAGIKSPADQYVSLMQSATVADRIIEQFDLMKVYDEKYHVEARRELAKNVRIGAGKKDGLITIEVDDESPQRAADIANRHIDELRRMTSQLALSESQQRRVFFEAQLKQTRDQLTRAQQALQDSGFTTGALKAEPKAAAEGYAKLKAEATAAEVRFQALRRNLTDGAPEVQQQLATLEALRVELAKLEAASPEAGTGPDYVSKYREFKYQETLFELFSRQYELARLDESREGALIQVIDPATPPEKKSRPKRTITAAFTVLVSFVVLSMVVVFRAWWHQVNSEAAPEKESQPRARDALPNL